MTNFLNIHGFFILNINTIHTSPRTFFLYKTIYSTALIHGLLAEIFPIIVVQLTNIYLSCMYKHE